MRISDFGFRISCFIADGCYCGHAMNGCHRPTKSEIRNSNAEIKIEPRLRKGIETGASSIHLPMKWDSSLVRETTALAGERSNAQTIWAISSNR